MPVPKKHKTKSKTNSRRSHHALKAVQSLTHGVNHRLKKFFNRAA